MPIDFSKLFMFVIAIFTFMIILPLYSGIGFRAFCFVIFLIVTNFYLVRYSKKIKADPTLSPMYDLDKENDLNKVIERFKKIIQGAALIADVDYEIDEGDHLANKIPVLKLNDLLMKNAELCGAPRITPPREKTGSTDFSNIM